MSEGLGTTDLNDIILFDIESSENVYVIGTNIRGGTRGVATGGVGVVATSPLLKTASVNTPTFERRNRNKN